MIFISLFYKRCNLYSYNFLRGYSTNAKRSKWEGVIGLEVHAQILSSSKLFSGASTKFGLAPNKSVSFFDAAIPGTLPVLNGRCVEAAILACLSLNAKVCPVSMFDRKHYFYADLPAGYQITQQRMPIACNGKLDFHVSIPGKPKVSYKKSSKIKQIQLEQDSGKSIHDDLENRSLIDLNRAGVGLMEIVFEPDLQSGEEAAGLVKELALILTKINTCSCKMEEGALRVDANISIRQIGSTNLGTRTEVKNIGSVRGVAKAIDYEIERQINILSSGGTVINETRAWNSIENVTVAMRDKEIKQDYRFMPEPNLPPLVISSEEIKRIKSLLPELPEETRNRLQRDYNISADLAYRLVSDNDVLWLFSSILKDFEIIPPKLVANFIINEVLTLANSGAIEMSKRNVNPKVIGEIVELLASNEINMTTSRKVLEEVARGEENPKKLVMDRGWVQINNDELIKKLCLDVINENPKMVLQYQSGKTKVFAAFMGIISKSSENKVNLKQASEIMKELLTKHK